MQIFLWKKCRQYADETLRKIVFGLLSQLVDAAPQGDASTYEAGRQVPQQRGKVTLI